MNLLLPTPKVGIHLYLYIVIECHETIQFISSIDGKDIIGDNGKHMELIEQIKSLNKNNKTTTMR